MGWRSVIGLAGVALAAAGALVACQQPVDDGTSAGDQAAVQQSAFDRNDVLDDKSLRDSAAMSVDDVQKFLDHTPWVGEKGGGKVGVGGAYLHWDVWGSFASFLQYGDWAPATQAESADGGGGDPPPSDDAGAADPNPNPDPSPDPDPAGGDAGPT